MRHKILWLMVSWLIVAALVLASCAPAVGEQEEEEEEEPVGEQEEEEEEPAVGEPQYGGTLTIWEWTRGQQSEPYNPDRMTSSSSNANFWLQNFQERPLVGDFEKFGPRGNNEFGFHLTGFIPEVYMKGCLLESWEVTPEKVVWHVRPGVYWHGNKPHVMESRELTANDMVAWLLRFKSAPAGVKFSGMAGDIYTTDKYTLEIEFSKGYNLALMYLVGYEDRATVEPPETVAAGADKWENQVGTGPFMNKEYAVGQYLKCERNPNYWKGTVIDGVEYEIPFVDELIYPIIPDEATQIAALRTGVLDWFASVPPTQWDSLAQTAPGLLSYKTIGASGGAVALKVNQTPFDNVNVRRALMVGTDITAFSTMLGLPFKTPVDFFPLYSGDPAYTPLEELPAENQLLFDYNPTLAKQMMGDAGYPDGFKMELVCETTVARVEQAALLEYQWSLIGVTVDIIACDATTFANYRYDKSFRDALLIGFGGPNAATIFQRQLGTDNVENYAMYSTPEMDELLASIEAEMDLNIRTDLIWKAAQIVRNDVPYIPTQVSAIGYFWWPWIKNYYGEFNVGDAHNPIPILACAWLDLDLKAEMGY